MTLKYTLGLIGLALGVAHAAPSNCHKKNAVSSLVEAASSDTSSSSTTNSVSKAQLPLVPISHVGGHSTRFIPQKNITLAWQTPDTESFVSVDLVMQNTAVALEDVEDLAAVDCIGNHSVAVTFSNAEALDEALAEWSALHDKFVLITNHMGDCDAELERSFFLADSDTLASFPNNLTIIASAEKSDVVNTATSTSIDFSSIAPVSSSVDKRALSWNADGTLFSYNYTVPSNKTIIDTSAVAIRINEAHVNNHVTYSGRAKWELFKGVTEFYIDINKTMDHYANMDVEIKSPISTRLAWSPDFLEISALYIPGIIRLGPTAGISFGAAVTAEAGGKVQTDFSARMPNGSVHIDLNDWDSSYSHGWDIERDASFNVTQDFGLTLQPYIDFTVEFACEIFGGLIDLGTGVKAEPSFPFTTTFLAPSQAQPPDSQNTTLAPSAATAYLNSTGGAPVYPNSTVARRQEVCASGVREDIAFQFDIIAFATKFLSTSLYQYKQPIWSGCI